MSRWIAAKAHSDIGLSQCTAALQTTMIAQCSRSVSRTVSSSNVPLLSQISSQDSLIAAARSNTPGRILGVKAIEVVTCSVLFYGAILIKVILPLHFCICSDSIC